jgi:uncharacterized protein YfaS (alpha-2-macroglobulin family)
MEKHCKLHLLFKPPFMRLFIRFSILLFIGISLKLTAQAQKYTVDDFYKIDSIAHNAQPKDALVLVNKFYNQAKADGNSELLVKSVIYKMLFQSYLEENSFDLVLSDLRKDIATAKQPEKSVLQSLLAETYKRYLAENFYRIYNRTYVQGQTSDDINTWSTRKLTDEIIKNYNASLSQTELLQHTKIDIYDRILIGDKTNRIFRPTLYDFLAHRAIDAFIDTRTNLIVGTSGAIDFTDPDWFSSREVFVKKKLPESDSLSTDRESIRLFQQLLQFNAINNQPAALADIDLKRLKFIYQQGNTPSATIAYDKALTLLANSNQDTEIYADILVEQAQLYKNQKLNTELKGHNLVKAVQLANQAIKSYPKSLGAENAKRLIASIEEQQITIRTKQLLQPNLPAQLHFTYKNVDTIYLSLYKQPMLNRAFQAINKKGDFINFMTKNQPIKKWMVITPKAIDYQTHTLIDKLDALGFGSYLLISQSSKTDTKTTRYTTNSFTVTNLAFHHRTKKDGGKQYLITDLTNGKPLKDVKITPIPDSRGTTITKETLITDELGTTLSYQHNYDQALLQTGKDSLVVSVNDYRYNPRENSKRVVLFTDRPIYRPGQTVYYKGILITTVEGQKNTVIPAEILAITFEDANGKKIAELNHETNEFGTFQGSFTIPMGKMNGRMSLETAYGSISVQVEEYKRPTFEITFDKPTQRYLINDSVKIKGKALSFSGYTVSNAKVSYIVYRRNISPYDYDFPQDYNQRQMAIGSTKTTAGGLFEIDFFAKVEDTNKKYQFEVAVTITDINGETRTNRTQVNVGKSDMILAVATPPELFLTSKKDSIRFSILNLNNAQTKGKIRAEWSLLHGPDRLVNSAPFQAENYTMGKAEFIKLFPHDAYKDQEELANWPVERVQLIQDTITSTGAGVLKFDIANLKPGYYSVRFTAENEFKDTVSIQRFIAVYGPEPAIIQHQSQWLTAETTVISPNEEAVFRVAGLTKNSSAYYEIYDRNHTVERVWLELTPKQKFVRIKARPEFEQGFAVQFTMVSNGTVYNSLQNVYIVDKAKQLEVKFLTFRDKLQPGEKEQWKLQISNKYGEKQLAEMVATLYDASLDALYRMNWVSTLSNSFNYQYNVWRFATNDIHTGNAPWYIPIYNTYYMPRIRDYENLNLFGYNYYGAYNSGYQNYIRKIRPAPTKGLSETAKKKLLELADSKLYYGAVFDDLGYVVPGAVIKNGKNTTTANFFGLYSISAKPGDRLVCEALGYEKFEIRVGNRKRIDVTLKGGRQELNEVMIAAAGEGVRQASSVTGSISYDKLEFNAVTPLAGKVASANEVLKVFKTQQTDIVPRTNFNETAFFYPQLRTDENGIITIEFTIPQSLTRYKMMGFAHTKDLSSVFVSNELVTQKQLAISANAPRFFREGDTIVFSAKLNNLSGKNLNGEANLELKDALTGKIIQLQTADTKLTQKFELANEGNQVLKWTLVIPSGINAISYKLLAEADKFTDGEEMTIPVLPNKMLVTETLPLNVRGNTSKVFKLDQLLASGTSQTLRHQGLTIEFTSNPIWYAVQALPYLMEYPYECAEQTFSRFFANSFATGIINSNPKIKDVFTQWQQTKNGEALLSNLEKNQELKSILLEETPWVREASQETERKKRLAILFDLNRMSNELKNNFDKLEKMQDAEGSFPWFNGMPGNRYITQHIVLGMGQLQKSKLIDEHSFPTYKTILNKAFIYLDNQFINDFKRETGLKTVGYLPLHYLFARSYTNQKNTNPAFDKAFQYYLKKITSVWKISDTYQQAQIALVLARAGNKVEALKIINLLKQTAQHSEEMGMYWKNNQNGWWWYQSPIETQAILIEAFDEVANDQQSVEEMKIWLLKNKQTNDWKTTKATAAACYALLMRGYNLLSENNEPEITIGNQPLTSFEGANTPKEAGTGYQKVRIEGNKVTPEMGKVAIKNNNKSIAWGGLYWQYFEQLDKITPASTGVKIKKQLFKQQSSTKGEILTPLSASNQLEIGDLLKVRVEIYVDRDMEYVHLKDMRSAGLEPINVISRYKYQDGLGYYESTKDASTNFFISYLPKGTYVFEYPLRVTHSGNFSNGITTLQCMYAPEFSTHSEGTRLTVH